MWRDRTKTRCFLENLEPELFVEEKEDWYSVGKPQVNFGMVMLTS